MKNESYSLSFNNLLKMIMCEGDIMLLEINMFLKMNQMIIKKRLRSNILKTPF